MTHAPDDEPIDPRYVDLVTGLDAALADHGPDVGWDAPTLPRDLRVPFEHARDCLVLLARVWPRPEAPGAAAPAPAGPSPLALWIRNRVTPEGIRHLKEEVRTLAGRFQIERRLGRGSFGTVYRVHDPVTRGPLAVKLLHRVTPEGVGRFKQEFRTLADVAHPNLVTFHELIGADGAWLITMELVDGTDLRSHLRARPGDWDRLRAVLRQLALGVNAMHGNGILHRDLKPHNVLVTDAGHVKVVDCGIATYLAAQDGRPTYLAGTAGYMSPEQAGCLPLGPASDWYSVGVMLYEALAGTRPLAETATEVLRGQRAPAPVAPLPPGVPGDLAALCEALLCRDPAGRPSGAEVLLRLGGPAPAGGGTAAAGPAPAFVGRAAELAELHQAFRQVGRRHAQVVCVHGPSGIGKSTLIRQFVEQLRAGGDAVALVGRCHERESLPFKAFDGLVDALARFLQDPAAGAVAAVLPADVGLLAKVFPALRTVPEVERCAAAAPEVPDPVDFRRRAFGSLRDVLGRLARDRAVVLVIDDLQWGDEDSARLLVDLLAPPDPPPVLLLGCCRSENLATSPFVRSLAATAAVPGAALRVRELEVGTLSDAETRALAAALLGTENPPERAALIARESGGVPFFLEQLARSVWTAAPAAGRDANLGAVIRARVDQLPADARTLLEAVAVAGRPVRQHDAYAAAGIGLQRRDALTALQAGQFVRTTGPGADDLVDAYHARIRDAVSAGLGPQAVARHHLRLAVTLRDSGRGDPEAVSDHFLGAGEHATAAEFAERAADQAVAAVAFDRAARLYRRVLELAPATPRYPEVRRKLADVLAHAGRGAEAGPEYLALAAGSSGPEQIDLRRRAAHEFLTAGLFEQGYGVVEAVLAAVGTGYPRTPRRRLLALLWQRARLWLGGYRFRCSPGPVAAPDRTRLEAYWTAFVAMGNTDNLRAIGFATRHLRLALRVGDPRHLAIGFAGEAFVIGVEPSLRPRARQFLATAEELAGRSPDPYPAALIAVVRAFLAVMEGRWRDTVALSDAAVAICHRQCPGAQPETFNARLSTFHALFHLGELRDLAGRLPPLLREADARGDVLLFVFLRTGCCNAAWLAADDPRGARAEARAATDRWPSREFHFPHYWALVAECQIDLYEGRAYDAHRRLEERWAALAGSHLLRVPIIRIDMWNLRARCALARAAAAPDPRPFLRAAERDARRIERERAGWSDPVARLLRAGVAAVRGDAAGAAGHLAAAARDLDAADMGLYAAAARRCLGRIRGGEEGAALVRAADAWMHAQNIRRPDRMSHMLAPGFPAGPG
ncbi:serine/threonine-protein kinase [Gemmata sp.]|uniref:serine/threonine-protein kinase n=1 Tax=Gemmata sp. TaxID=1914242 RepID=UPI003F727817